MHDMEIPVLVASWSFQVIQVGLEWRKTYTMKRFVVLFMKSIFLSTLFNKNQCLDYENNVKITNYDPSNCAQEFFFFMFIFWMNKFNDIILELQWGKDFFTTLKHDSGPGQEEFYLCEPE